MPEVKCANKTCQWYQKGKCVLFPGVTQLECKHRIEPKTKTTKTTKKGK